ncbi:MAG: hypothetical protein FI717_10820 [SAR202 cluster bacterium]|nr:hypothetical protein [SAR202 cluster bacterium]
MPRRTPHSHDTGWAAKHNTGYRLAPKAAAGGSNLKMVSYFGLMSVVSGGILATVPVVTGAIFGI